MTKAYYYRYGPLCELGSSSSSTDCRYNNPTGGFGNSQCVRTGIDGMLRLVGYAVDGFRIFTTDHLLGDDQLDNCNGRFLQHPVTGLYSYAYIVSTNATYARFPYIIGCLGPGTYWRNGTHIDYRHIRDFLDTTCTT